MSNRIIVLVLVAVLAATGLVLLYNGLKSEDDPARLQVGLDFTISGYHAPWFLAVERGYFAAEGLDVVINRGYGSVDTVKKLQTGAIDVGFAHPAPLILANADGASLRIVMGYFVNEMCTLYSYREHGNVDSVGALAGKRWGGPAGDICAVLVQPLCEAAGQSCEGLEFINMDAPTRLPALVNGDIDVTGSFLDKDILFEKAGQQAGLTLVRVRYSDYLHLVSNSVIVQERLSQDHPEVVRGLVRALARGLEDAIRDPEAAIAAMLQANPELDPEYARSSVLILAEVTSDPATEAHGTGFIDAAKMEATVASVAESWKLSNPPTPGSLYTNEFVAWAQRHRKE